MRQQFKAKQSGISFFGLVIVMILMAVAGLLAAKVFPTALEYSAIQKAVNKAAKEGNSVADVRTIFDKAADIDAITSISGKDLTITKNGDNMLVSFAYDREIALFGPAYLLLKYTGQSRLQTR